MTDENSNSEAPGMGKFATAMVWIVSLSVIVGSPLLGWAWFESQSVVRDHDSCEIEDTYVLKTNSRYGSKEELVLRTPCGEFAVDKSYSMELFPGDIVDLTVKYYPGANKSVESLTVVTPE